MIDFNAASKPQDEKPPKMMDEIREEISLHSAPYDLTPIKKRFEAIKEKIDKMVTTSANHKVIDAETEKVGIEMMSQAKKLWKKIDDQRKIWKAPHLEFNKAVENLCKTYQDPLKKIEDDQKRMGSDYQTRLILAQREAEKKAREAAEKVQKEVDKEAKDRGVEPVQMPLQVAREPEKTKRTEEGSITYEMDWSIVVNNIHEVPDEFVIKMLNKAEAKKAIRAGRTTIPGLDIKEIPKAKLRV